MNDDSPQPSQPGDMDDVSVWEAIQTFETILEVFPEDVSALESLAVAYEQAGDTAKAREKYLDLARILARQNDWEGVRKITRRVLAFDPNDADALELDRQAGKALGGEADLDEAPVDTAPKAAPVKAPETRSRQLAFDLRGELELGWTLLQNDLITQEQYERAIEALTEHRMNPQADASLSLLQELAGMEKVNMDRILDFLVQETNVPFIHLSRFEIEKEVAAVIPLSECRRAGVLPFGKTGDEYMVALQNPVDPELQNAVSEFLGARVHFYLTSPEDFAAAISHLEQHTTT